MIFYPVEDLRNNAIFLRLRRTADAQPEKRWLPAYYFDICLLDGTRIGYCDLRVGHNDKTYIGGNIGYGIDAPYRGHHYAAQACRLLFRQAGKHGMGYVIITCDPSNRASARTCEIAGGQYLETAPVPRENEMYAEGKRQVMVYRFDLAEADKPGVDQQAVRALFDRYVKKLRITPAWDVRLEFVRDPAWPKTGDFKIDCDDRKAILLLNAVNPKQENLEEVIVHELMHIKMYPLDQVTESLVDSCFPEGSAEQAFARRQFFTTLEQTVEELAKCFLLEVGDNREFSYGRCKGGQSFNELYDGLKAIE